MMAPIAQGFFGELWDFLGDADNWTGKAGIPNRMLEHLQMSAVSLLVAALIAIPVGLVLGHYRRGGTIAIGMANVGRAIPTFGLLVISFRVFGLGPEAPFVSLVALAIPPILVNTYTGMSEVGDDLREAAAGMGMRGRDSVRHVELPVALPLVITGLRIAAVQVVATATLAAIIAWGGLGRFIVDGIAQQDDAEMWTGALLVALLAVLTEVAFTVLERVTVSPGLRVRPERGARPDYGARPSRLDG